MRPPPAKLVDVSLRRFKKRRRHYSGIQGGLAQLVAQMKLVERGAPPGIHKRSIGSPKTTLDEIDEIDGFDGFDGFDDFKGFHVVFMSGWLNVLSKENNTLTYQKIVSDTLTYK